MPNILALSLSKRAPRRWRGALAMLAMGLACTETSIIGRAQSGPPPIPELPAKTEAYGSANGLALANEFLAYASREDPVYRKDPQMLADPSKAPVGRLVAKSSMVGYFSFLPKEVGDLTPEQRIALLKDPRFHRFLTVLRIKQDDGGADPTKEALAGEHPPALKPPTFSSIAIEFSAAEMITRHPIVIALPGREPADPAPND